MASFVLYEDEDSQARALASALRSEGLTVRSSNELGMDGSGDEEQLRFATDRGWVIYTSNVRDFAVLHRDWINHGRGHSGIIYNIRRRYSVGQQARRIYRIWQGLSAEEMVNRYESLSQWGDPAGLS